MINFLPSIFVGILTVMSMFASNADRIGWNQLPVSLGFAVLIGLFFAFIFWLNPPTQKSSAFLASVFTVCFMLWYGITPYAGAIIVILALVAGIKFKLTKVAKPLSLILAFAIVISTGQALFSTNWESVSANTVIMPRTDKLPNIYFIIPDRFTSIQALNEVSIETTEFISELESMGFYIKDNQMSHDEYRQKHEGKVTATRTMRYLSSVLNMGAEVGLQTPYRTIFAMIRNPRIVPELHSLGYEYNHIGSWFTESYYCPDADVNYVYEGGTLYEKLFKHEFTTAVWNRTILKGVNFGKLWEGGIDDLSRARLVYQLGAVTDVAEKDNQHFAFVHLVMPHEPYVFTADGNPQTDRTLSDLELYYEQVRFTMRYLVDMAKEIIKNDPAAIIIIQSDEGMVFSQSPELTYALTDTQWNGVLTAWRIPSADRNELTTLKHTDILKYLVDYLSE